MSAHSMQQTQGEAKSHGVAIFVVPTLLAVLALSMVIGMSAGAGSQIADESAAAPTPYSADHARIPAESEPREQPPTF
jgi:hypothetical protein